MKPGQSLYSSSLSARADEPQIVFAKRREIELPLTKQQHLDPNHAPKRMLSLDGGGIRGVLTLEILDAIEAMLRGKIQ